jgi:ferrochelatase
MPKYIGREKNLLKKLVSKPGKTAVLLTNLGTPEAPTASALRIYLREFLSDTRVVEIPRLLWLLILHGIILRIRPKKSAKLYQSIWTEQGSPLMVLSKALKDKIAIKINKEYGDDIIVDVAMRYGKPEIKKALNSFQEQGVDNIVVLPLYPQYAAPTTGSTFDAVVNEIKSWRWVPSVHFISGYHDSDLYIQALANTVHEHVKQFGKPDKFLLSYHGMPQLFLDRGDPYYYFCCKTTELLMDKLGLSADDYVMTFQSRFGKAQWLQPYTDETLTNLAKDGIKHVAVLSPAFSVDCLETLEELVHENKDIFIQAGGEDYHYIAALNDRDDHCAALVELLDRQLGSTLDHLN